MSRKGGEVFEAGRQYGVKQAMLFLIEAYDEPTEAEEIGRFVLPSRQWRRRFHRAVLIGHDEARREFSDA